MNQEGSNNQFRALHKAILRTHSELLKKRESMIEFNNRMTIFSTVDMINPEDMAQYLIAHSEAHEAYAKWRKAQLKYFQFIEKQKVVS